MTGTFSEKGIGNWTFSAHGRIFPLPPDLTGRVKQTMPNRAERRAATRRGGRAAGKSGTHGVSPAASPGADAGSRERLDPPVTTPTGSFANASVEFSQAVLDSEAPRAAIGVAGTPEDFESAAGEP